MDEDMVKRVAEALMGSGSPSTRRLADAHWVACDIIAALTVLGLLPKPEDLRAQAALVNCAPAEQPSPKSDPESWRSWESDQPPLQAVAESLIDQWLRTDGLYWKYNQAKVVAHNRSISQAECLQPSPPKVVVTEEMVYAATKEYWRALGDVEDGVRAALTYAAPMIAEQVRGEMSEFWTFAGEHYVVLFFMMLFGTSLIPIVTRLYRVLMVWGRGWPPAHLDADGDWKPSPPDLTEEKP